MELKECITCGSHSFTNNKCDYCGNQYEVEQEYQDLYDDDKHALRTYSKDRQIFWKTEIAPLSKLEPEEEERPAFIEAFEVAAEHDAFMIKLIAYVFGSIIWFAVTVFIPPLFIITIILLVIYGIYRLTKRKK